MDEPLLCAPENQYVTRWLHPDLKEKYDQHMDKFWRVDEIPSLSGDQVDFKALTKPEQDLLLKVLAFFAGSDGIVMENLCTRFVSEIQWPEVRAFYAIQNLIEVVHSETYTLFLETLVPDRKEQEFLFSATSTLNCVKSKADWALKYARADLPFADRLVAFMCVEGIFFSCSFSTIYWLKQRCLMHALTFSNELIAGDEKMHVDYAIHLYTKYVKNKLSPKTARQILVDACEIEMAFARECLPENLVQMNADMMCQCVQYHTDRIWSKMGYEGTIYGADHPFHYQVLQSIEQKTNFFEHQVAQYSLAKITDTNHDELRNLTSLDF